MKATNEKLQLNFRRIILIITDILCVIFSLYGALLPDRRAGKGIKRGT